jgi:hypothetical protein
MSITAVLLPFVTYLLTLPHTIKSDVQHKLQAVHVLALCNILDKRTTRQRVHMTVPLLQVQLTVSRRLLAKSASSSSLW